MQCGDFNQLTAAGGWPYRAETRRNSKIKRDFNDILESFNVIVMTFKKKVYIVLEMETSGQVIRINNVFYQKYRRVSIINLS